ncbi:MAG: ComEA family DNA-binding protein [Erysipelotrichaceae bacterium]|nr:ComEA family DNA-binding protein [Erysipelotrichaceae bacterium]
MTVEIKGCVRRPGIYELELGSDMDDLFQIAELLENADFSSFSLNSKLYNDQLIIVPEIIEEKKISINSADIEELCTLPGIGPKIAQRILDYRIKQGSFLSLEEIKNVSGIGNVKFKRIKELITL